MRRGGREESSRLLGRGVGRFCGPQAVGVVLRSHRLPSPPAPHLGRKDWPAARPAVEMVVLLGGAGGSSALENRGPPRGTDGVRPHPPPRDPGPGRPARVPAAKATFVVRGAKRAALGIVRAREPRAPRAGPGQTPPRRDPAPRSSETSFPPTPPLAAPDSLPPNTLHLAPLAFSPSPHAREEEDWGVQVAGPLSSPTPPPSLAETARS